MIGCDMEVVYDHQGQQHYAPKVIDFATTC